MENLPGAWAYIASIQASVAVGILLLLLLMRNKNISQSTENTDTRTARAVGMLGLCMGFYTLSVLVTSQLLINKGPTVSELVNLGFGDERVAWILLAVITEQAVRLFDMLRK